MILNYKGLFEPYTKDGHTLENSMKYWAVVAQKHKISSDVMEVAINEVFSAISNGKVYQDGPCPCGCASNFAATALIHEVESRMLSLDKKMVAAASEILGKRFDTVIQEQLKKISKTNKEYIKMNRPPISERSPVLRGLKNLMKGNSNG